MNAVNRSLMIGVLLAIAGGMVACGSSNNDQGVSFSQIGYFSSFDRTDPTEPGELCDTGLAGGLVVISSGDGVEVPLSLTPVFFNRAQTLFQNNLVGQTIRLQGISLEYFIPGAKTQPPSSFVATSGIMGPVSLDISGGGTTSLPPNNIGSGAGTGTGNPNLICTEFIMIPESILQWMSLNRDQLPELPYEVVLTTTGVGVTSAGDSLQTNPLTLPIYVTEDNVIPPTVEAPAGP